MFWNKNDTSKNINSSEYEDALKRIAKLHGEVELVKGYIEAYKLQLDNLRGNFSRKLKGIKEEEQKEEEKIQPKEEDIAGGQIAFG